MTTLNKKKVLFLITKSNWGGAQRYVYDLATNLDKTKFDITVALGGHGPLSDMLKNAGIRTIELNEMRNTVSSKQFVKILTELFSVLKTEKPDIFHLNSSIAGLLGALVGRVRRVPNIIFTAHGWAFNEDRPLWQRLIIKFLHWFTVLLSHRTIAVSSAIVKQMNWPGVKRKMKIVNPGRTIGAMYEQKEAREKIIGFYPKLQPYTNDTWLVCIAELHPIKRHSILIQAFIRSLAENKNLRLILIGEGGERSELEKQIINNHLTERVFLLGNIVEAARFLKAFDLFVLTSKSESYGYVLHEAGLARVPIIATNTGGITDIITNGADGTLVPVDNVEILSQKICDSLNHKVYTETLAQNLHDKLAQRTTKQMTKVTEILYG